MQLTPVYGERAVVRADVLIADPGTPLLRQGRRLAATLATLDEGQWAAPSRCEGWSVQDVVAHLVTATQFWAFSIDAGLRGEPTRFMANFDPVATPADMVAAVRATSPQQTLEQLVEANDALAAVIERVDGAWSTPAEAPPGHVAIALVAQHALWDSWVHERDIVLPLGLPCTVEADEVAASLTYAAALSPAFLACQGSTRSGVVEVCTTEPDVHVRVEVGAQVVIGDGPAPAGAIRITGDAVAVLEALSHRGPFPVPLAPADRWVLGGLEQAFDVAG